MSALSIDNRPEAVLTYTTLKDRIRADIINGKFPPGIRLKFEDLARQFGTSTMPVRQALQDLHAEGVVVYLPNRGASVRKVDRHLAECIYDVRKHLIALILERCVLYITNADLGELTRMERAIRASDDVDAIVNASSMFYQALFRISRNEVATNVLDNIWPLISALRRHYGLRDQRAVYENNRALLSALGRRDATEAVRIAQRSCEESKRDLIARLTGPEA